MVKVSMVKNHSGLVSEQTLLPFMLVIFAFVIIIVGMYLAPTLFSFANSSYTAVNSSTSVGHSSQGIIPIVILMYLIILIAVPLGMLGYALFEEAHKAKKNMTDLLMVVILAVVVFILSFALYTPLVSATQSASTSLSSYSWGTGFVSLLGIVPLVFMVLVVLISVGFLGFSIKGVIASR